MLSLMAESGKMCYASCWETDVSPVTRKKSMYIICEDFHKIGNRDAMLLRTAL